MDRIKEASDIIVCINKYNDKQLEDYELIRVVCSYFDRVKNQKLDTADLQFLKYISNKSGIPHFYDLLANFENKIDLDSYSLNTLSSIFYESTLHTSENSKIHKYQKEVLDRFNTGKLNRFFLSATTSFGKTFIVFEILKKMNYNNVVLIFPTIALLSENYERLISNDEYSYFRDNFTIHTLSEVKEIKEKNIFIYTPERFLSFIEKNKLPIKFDFVFIDEIYKIDNDYLIDNEVKENERDVAYRLAVFYSLKTNIDVLLAGPYINFSYDSSLNNSFENFRAQNHIDILNYNDYEIVGKKFYRIDNKADTFKGNELSFDFKSINKDKMLIEIIESIISINENTIIYCSTRSQVESCAKKIIKAQTLNKHDNSQYLEFINHISNNFKEEWILIQALKCGIGIHHGLVPKYIQKEIISLFNNNLLRVLISTTTITEGVNTSAKNLIVLESKKGDKELKKFDAKNIAGRAGRFSHHYSGRVIVLKNNFMEIIDSVSEGIKHKNFDKNSPKDEIDLYYTTEEFLTESDKQRKVDLSQEQLIRNIPDFIFDQYTVVSRMDKMKVYDEILKLNAAEIGAIPTLIARLNFVMDIDYDGFQIILKVIEPIIRNAKLKFLVEHKPRDAQYSILTHLVHYYLVGGFTGSVHYKIKNGQKTDAAIRETAEFIYNILKYQLVKYLGVFNIMYKLHLSIRNARNFDDITGIDILLVKLEHNALSEEGRIASDYGVPSKVVDYYEDPDFAQRVKAKFDKYEMEIFEKINKIINRENNNNIAN